jgi:hypothetical protein
MAFPQDLGKFDRVKVSPDEISDAYDLITREVNCRAAFQNICNFLKLSEVKLKGNEIKNNPHSYRNTWFNQCILPHLTELLMWFYVCGFCPYVMGSKWVRTKDDPKWMEEFKESFDKKNEAYKIKSPYLIIPEINTFETLIVTNKRTLEKEIECNIINSDFQKHTKINVFYSAGYFKLPRGSDGLLQSPIASLLYPYRELIKYKQFALQASHTLAFPTTFLQHGDTNKDDNHAKVTHYALFTEAEANSDPLTKNKGYEIMSDRVRHQRMLTSQFNKQYNSVMTSSQNYFNSSLTNQEVNQKFLTQVDNVYSIDEGLQLSKTLPQVAKIPEEIKDLRLSWPTDVAKAFQIPNATLANAKAGGASVKNYADIELKTLNSTIHNLTSELKYLFFELEEVLQLGTGDKKIEIEMHPQPFYDPAHLIDWWKEGLLDEWQMLTILEDSFGVPHDPKRILSHSTAKMEHVLKMKDQEVVSNSQVKKQAKVIENIDI